MTTEIVTANLPLSSGEAFVYLNDGGHDATHVQALSMSMAEDVEILQRARRDSLVIISSDTDFGMLLAAERAPSPLVILTREVSTIPCGDLADVLVMNLG